MNRAIVALGVFFALTASAVDARGGTVSVHGYVTKNGTYVAPYHRTAPDSTKLNNWSTQGNVNPYTGQPGTKPAYPAQRAYVPQAYGPAPQPSKVVYGKMWKYMNSDGTSAYTTVEPPAEYKAKVLFTYVETTY